MKTKLLGVVAACVLALGVGAVTSAGAATFAIGTEDSVNGFVGGLFGTSDAARVYLVASDGESFFDPFGFGANTSDGVNFSASTLGWTQAAGGLWTSLGNQTWVLPADLTAIGCGSESETTCEPVGHFISSLGFWFPDAIGTWLILEADGTVSDQIITFNDASGHANILFYSDPSLVPLPGALPLFATGLGLLGLLGWRRKRKNAAATAA